MIEIKMQNICVECVMCAICSWMRANNRFQDAAPLNGACRCNRQKFRISKPQKLTRPGRELMRAALCLSSIKNMILMH